MLYQPASRRIAIHRNVREGNVGSASTAEIHVTKLAAAKRLLCSAIRMYFSGEDELATHAVASAAYGIIKDLKSNRGRDEVGDYYQKMVFFAVRAYRRGTLSSYLADNREAMEFICECAEQLPIITATSEYEDFKTVVPPHVAKRFWNERNKVSNFLKHADRDADKHISMDEVDNLFLLMLALSSYCEIDKGGLGCEGLVFRIFLYVENGTVDDLSAEEHEIASHLHGLSREKRMKRCSEILIELNEKEDDM